MKLQCECIPCLIERAKSECDTVFKNEEEKILALKEFIAFILAHLDPSTLHSPPFFGTERERILQRRGDLNDPHEAVKKRSPEIAKGLLPEAYAFYDAAR